MNLNLLSDAEIASLRQIIASSERIVLCCHKSPDGDAIGSMIGWGDYLQMLGKKPMLVSPDAYPDFLGWLPGKERVVRHDKHKAEVEEAFAHADLVFCLDFNSSSRLLDMQEVFDASSARKVLIDHHQNPDVAAEMTISFPVMSSTSELVFRLIWQMDGFDQMPRSAAVNLYTGMMTDTGGFTYNSSRPEVYFIIGQLLTKGIDKDKIYRNVYNTLSESCLRMRGYVLSQKLVVFPNAHACYYTLTREEMKRFHFIRGDAEGLVNEPLRIRNMRLSISLREDTERERTIWVSLRSVDQYFCNVLAERFFNGGGHKNAAGGKLTCMMEEAEQVVHRAILYFAAHDGIVPE